MATGLWRYADLRAAGLGRGALYGRVDDRRLVRVGRGVYTEHAPSPADRLRALMARLPDGCVLGYQTAAMAYGFGVLPGATVHAIVPAGTARPKIRGVRMHESVLPVPEPVLIAGVPYTPPARCAVDLARAVCRFDALPVLDAALRVGACSADDLAAELPLHRGLKGVRQACELVRLADPGAECVQESQLRLVLVDGGLPAPQTQLWISDAMGTAFYRLDLGYPEHRAGAEYDGVSHLTRPRLRADRERQNWLHDHGWRVRYFTDRDLYRRPSYIVATMRAVLR